jgi:tetratricopeptide (TPR) repeat protein
MIRSLLSSLVLILLTAPGCSSLNSSLGSVADSRQCPKDNAARVVQRASVLGPQSTNEELACALRVLIASSDAKVIKSSLSSRLSLHLSEREVPGSERDRHIQQGIQQGENALKLGGDQDAAVHYYLGALMGLWLNDHPLDAGTMLTRVEKELNTASKLSESVDDGGPLRLLGMIYLKAPPWPAGMGDGDKALELLQKAATEYPQHPLNHAFYAKALIEVDDRKEDAYRQRDEGLKALQNDHWGQNRIIWQAEFDSLQKELAR